MRRVNDHLAKQLQYLRGVIELEAALNERLRDHPLPGAAFELAMKELNAAGHDLWSWTPEEVWGHDYVKSGGERACLSPATRMTTKKVPRTP